MFIDLSSYFLEIYENKDRQKTDAVTYKHQTIIYKFQTMGCRSKIVVKLFPSFCNI